MNQRNILKISILGVLLAAIPPSCSSRKTNDEVKISKPESLDFSRFPTQVLSNEEVEMKVFLPDPEKGMYRGTRFDWSGVIGSVKYRDHEYFGYWKEHHDPLYHEDLTGPVEGFIEPGLGYADALPGQGFIRIGVGILEKEEEEEYNWQKTYKILDQGKWTIDHGADWITFTHKVGSDLGYAYVYTKTIQLKSDGFFIRHQLQNTGEKPIETDQFNHNFFIIDGEKSGTAFQLRFPYAIHTNHDLKGYLEIEDKKLTFIDNLEKDSSVYMELSGFGEEIEDHQVTVLNRNSGAGVTFTVDKALYRMVFWACETTLSPENFIWISVNPGEEESWISDYTLFLE